MLRIQNGSYRLTTRESHIETVILIGDRHKRTFAHEQTYNYPNMKKL